PAPGHGNAANRHRGAVAGGWLERRAALCFRPLYISNLPRSDKHRWRECPEQGRECPSMLGVIPAVLPKTEFLTEVMFRDPSRSREGRKWQVTSFAMSR